MINFPPVDNLKHTANENQDIVKPPTVETAGSLALGGCEGSNSGNGWMAQTLLHKKQTRIGVKNE